MFDLTQTLLVVVIVVLTVILSVIGVQVVLLLKETRRSLSRVNDLLDSVEGLVDKLSHPTQSFSNLLSGVKQGVQIFESISSLFKSRSQPTDYENELP